MSFLYFFSTSNTKILRDERPYLLIIKEAEKNEKIELKSVVNH